MTYLLSITFAMCCAYAVLFFVFPLFFQNKMPILNPKSIYSIFYIILFSIVTYLVSGSIANPALSNRILHIFGGGFLAFLTCFLVAKDSKLQISKFQFFLFSFLIVIGLGVANEILEFFLQNYLHYIFSQSVNDTWLDLMSNVAGAVIASICLVPFIKKQT